MTLLPVCKFYLDVSYQHYIFKWDLSHFDPPMEGLDC